jgi:hypothetical protein
MHENLTIQKHPDGSTTKGLKPVSFKVEPEFLREYKQFALDNDMKLVDVFKRSFQIMKESSANSAR